MTALEIPSTLAIRFLWTAARVLIRCIIGAIAQRLLAALIKILSITQAATSQFPAARARILFKISAAKTLQLMLEQEMTISLLALTVAI